MDQSVSAIPLPGPWLFRIAGEPGAPGPLQAVGGQV